MIDLVLFTFPSVPTFLKTVLQRASTFVYEFCCTQNMFLLLPSTPFWLECSLALSAASAVEVICSRLWLSWPYISCVSLTKPSTYYMTLPASAVTVFVTGHSNIEVTLSSDSLAVSNILRSVVAGSHWLLLSFKYLSPHVSHLVTLLLNPDWRTD